MVCPDGAWNVAALVGNGLALPPFVIICPVELMRNLSLAFEKPAEPDLIWNLKSPFAVAAVVSIAVDSILANSVTVLLLFLKKNPCCIPSPLLVVGLYNERIASLFAAPLNWIS